VFYFQHIYHCDKYLVSYNRTGSRNACRSLLPTVRSVSMALG